MSDSPPPSWYEPPAGYYNGEDTDGNELLDEEEEALQKIDEQLKKENL